jgi:hypothetical protein
MRKVLRTVKSDSELATNNDAIYQKQLKAVVDKKIAKGWKPRRIKRYVLENYGIELK